MTLFTRCIVSRGIRSRDTGAEIGDKLIQSTAPHPLQGVLIYSTVNHDQPSLLQGLRSSLGPNVALVGCSTQGVMTRGALDEDGYVAAAMGFAGHDVRAAAAHVDAIEVDPEAKGRRLGDQLAAVHPDVVVILYDPLRGANIESLLTGLSEKVTCPIVGGGAGHRFGAWAQTYQYAGGSVHEGSAVALGLSGPFGTELACAHGTSPVGIELTITRADGNVILELDGDPAMDVMEDISGTRLHEHVGELALAIPVRNLSTLQHTVHPLTPEAVSDDSRRGLTVQTGVESGTRVLLHHRTIDGCLQGTRVMAQEVANRLQGRAVQAVLSFECGARTQPFLGAQAAHRENVELQECVAPDAAWLGMLAWGEVYPVEGRPRVWGYTFPLLLLTS